MARSVPDINDFASLFHGSIRAQLNWPALMQMQAAVSQEVAADWRHLCDLRTVWHVDSEGRAVDWWSAGAQPLTIHEAGELQDRWPPERAARVRSLRHGLRGMVEPQVLIVPAYRVRDQLLLLDATHRIMAGYLERADLRVLFMTIEAPPMPELLPDLGVVEGSNDNF